MVNRYPLSLCFKLVFFTLLISLTTLQEVKASHAMGADLTYTCIGSNRYRVRFTLFRDCDGITPASTQVVSYSSVSCGVNSSITLTQLGSPTDISPLCPSQTSSCAGGSNFGIQQWTYSGTLNLPPGCNDWILGWSVCCRNGAITTLSSASSQSMYVETRLDNTIVPCDGSPVFNNPPTAVVCVNQPVQYNHGVTDPDGDSLVFSLVNCQQSPSTTVNYGAGFNATTPLATTAGVFINPTNGQLTFTPNQVQVGVLCVLVEEFRNGVKIGQVVRDMQFNVIACSNAPPVATGMNATTVFDSSICVGSSICFNINISDANSNNIGVTWNNGIPTGQFTLTGNNTTSPSAQFCWTPTTADLGTQFFTVTLTDDACPVSGTSQFTYTITVYGAPHTLNAGPDVGVCLGGIANLSGSSSGATSLSWAPSGTLSNPNIANPTANTSTTTVYTLTGTFSDGCVLQDNMTVNVNPDPALTVAPGVAFACPGDNVLLTAISPTATSYNWSSGATTASAAVSPATTTTYTVTVTDANGCSSTDSATVRVNQPSGTSCNVVYASPTGNGLGTQTDPANLSDAIDMAACNNTIIKMAIGTYTVDTAMTNIRSSITLEGGFDPGNAWRKTSQAGATTILRTANNLDGSVNARRLVAIYMNGASNFRFQDLTIQTQNATGNGSSNYGLHLTNCSDYFFTRVQVLAGNAVNGSSGSTGASGFQGGTGGSGLDGDCDTESDPGHGGAGGNGAGTSPGNGGGGGFDANGGGCCVAGSAGTAGTDSGNLFSGGGGGGGGSGGEEDNSGGPGGQGGGINGGANTTGVGTGGSSGDPGNNGTNGSTGATGGVGGAGAAGSPGSHTGGFWLPGGIGGTGGQGDGGRGGAGGGGGGGQFCTFCDDGAGSGGGGGGGGGSGGSGGTGGRGGGSSYCVYLFNNGVNSIFDQCRMIPGNPGGGGSAGAGGSGGPSGNRGLGSSYRDCGGGTEVGRGGNGGFGGAGGAGGPGGAGQAGQAIPLLQNTGTSAALADVNFNLPGQPNIFMSNTSCTNTNVTYTSGVSGLWDMGAGGNPQFASGASVTTQYTNTGRKDIVKGTDQYHGFANIIQPDTLRPQAATNAPLVGPDYRICEGESASFWAANPGVNYVYNWDLGGGALPNTYSGVQFDTLNSIVFNTPGTYFITLRFSTDCCGLTSPDTIVLHVDPQPAVSIAGPTAFCLGDSSGVQLTASGASSYVWAPATGLTSTTTAVTTAKPTTTTTYTLVGTNAIGNCTDNTTVSVTVNDIQLTPSAVDASCGPNGSASVAVAGGSGTYSFLWPDIPLVTAGISGLLPATYRVTVTDLVTGCVDSTAAVVGSSPSNPFAFVSSTQGVTCNGASDGTATVAVTGGVAPYIATWVPFGVQPLSMSNLPPGNYPVTITDLNGCTTVTLVNIPEPTPVNVTPIDSVRPICVDSEDGAIWVNASGGNGPYTYTWNTNPVQVNDTASGLNPGTYTVVVTDTRGCADSTTVTLSSVSPCSLPVDYFYFTANPKVNFIQLDWKTAFESNNQGFEVQRGVDKTNFSNIGWMKSRHPGGTGSSPEDYLFDDTHVVPGVNYFYRLRQIDLDGNYSYSEIREAMLPHQDQLHILNFYPHPVNDIANVDVYLPEDASLRIELVTLSGQSIGDRVFDLTAGQHTLTYDFSDLAAGLYIGKITLDGKYAGNLKIVKAK